jgi:hypothetical protein
VAAKVTVGGSALLVGTPGTVAGVCRSGEQIPAGPPVVTSVQRKVSAL